jgi:hypothetical protein
VFQLLLLVLLRAVRCDRWCCQVSRPLLPRLLRQRAHVTLLLLWFLQSVLQLASAH